ncbi:MAG: hypothetical protein CSA35_02205 [Dethiosulfovibrio peptidovorans]|nr:MAG: hypothetical protein CSA35_02205 [Dethiosulfovibrio peptidovorans]
MYEDDKTMKNQAAENDEMNIENESVIEDEFDEDFDDDCCCSDYESGGGESKLKKYGLLIFVVVVFLGLFSGIMLRLDRLENQMADARKDAVATETSVMEATKAIDAQIAEIKSSFQAMGERLDIIAKANTGAVEAVEEMKKLYADTDKVLRETLVARDQLIREIINNLRLP